MNTINCCIVCYKTLHFPLSPTGNANEECVIARFIRLFERHVNNFSFESTQIKVRNSALTFLSTNGNGEEQRIKFQTCTSCSDVLSSFNASYGQLKCAEMKANWSLQLLANVIGFADHAPARRDKCIENVSSVTQDNLLVDDMVEIIGNFRKQLQHQCRVRYKNQFPRVVLMKPSKAKFPTDHLTKDKEQQKRNLPKKSKDALLSTALKNLSSLQLILYLALFDSTQINKRNISKPDFDANHSLEDDKSSVYSGEQAVMDADDSVFGDDNDDHRSCSNDAAPATNSDVPTTKFTQYRIQIIKNVNAHKCFSCQQRFDSVNGFQQHLLTCSKTCQIPVAADVQIKQEPIEIPNQIKMKGGTTCSETPTPDATNCSSSNVRVKQKPVKKPNQAKMKQIINVNSSNKYRCKQCGLRCPHPSKLRVHELTHLGPENWKHSCSHCGKRFIKKSDMKSHLRIHTGEKPYKCPVENCKVAFNQNQSLRKHLQKIHKQETKVKTRTMNNSFKCPEDSCNKTFYTFKHLENHLLKYHKNK